MSGVRQWPRDLAMGARFAFTGGREGWIRAVLTAVGVGLGVALLLLTTALPGALAARDRRESAHTDLAFGAEDVRRGAGTLLVANLSTTFRDEEVRGRGLEPEGPRAPLPPGVSRFPAAGEMVVSPALKRLLSSSDGRLRGAGVRCTSGSTARSRTSRTWSATRRRPSIPWRTP